MANIANLAVQMSGNTGRFSRDMKGAQTDILATGRAAAIMKSSAIAAGAALGALSLAGAVGLRKYIGLMKEGAANLDRMAKLSSKLEISQRQLAGLELLGDRSGVGIETITSGMERAQKSISEAAQGFGTGERALEELGLDAKELNRLSPDKQIRKIATAMQSVENRADQLRLTTDIFGRSGGDMIRIFDQGADAIDNAVKRAEQFGRVYSGKQLREVERMNDAFADLNDIAKGAGEQGAAAIAPTIANATEGLRDAAIEGGRLKRFMDGAARSATGAITGQVAALTGFIGGQAALVGWTEGAKFFLKTSHEAHKATMELAGLQVKRMEAQTIAMNAASAAMQGAAAGAANATGPRANAAMNAANMQNGIAKSAMNAAKVAGRAMEPVNAELKAQAEAVFLNTRTMAERTADEIRKVNALFERGLIDDDTLQRAMDQIIGNTKTQDAFSANEQRFGEVGRGFLDSILPPGLNKAGDLIQRNAETQTQLLTEILYELQSSNDDRGANRLY